MSVGNGQHTEDIYRRIRGAILDGELAAGAVMSQVALAEELGISRTPLREALRMLEREGLVKVAPGRGLRVVTADLPALLDAYELREMIDGLAARLAARDADPALTETLEAILRAQEAALDPWTPPAYTAANVAFHRAIVEGSRNEHVVAQLPLVRMTSQIFTPLKLLDAERAALAVAEHRAIATAITAREQEDAEGRARAHIRTTIAGLEKRRATEAS